MDIALFAPEALRAELEPHLRWAKPAPLRRSSKLPLPPPAPSQTGVQGTASPSKGKGKATSATSVAAIAPEPGETPAQTAARQRKMQQVLQALQRVKGDEKHGDEVLDALSDAKDVLELPFPKSAPGIISGDLNVDLLNHQLQVRWFYTQVRYARLLTCVPQGLRWMRRAEAPKLPQRVEDPPVQLIKMQTRSGGQGSYWLNLASKQPTSEQPKLARGGMLCDAMGSSGGRGGYCESVKLTRCSLRRDRSRQDAPMPRAHRRYTRAASRRLRKGHPHRLPRLGHLQLVDSDQGPYLGVARRDFTHLCVPSKVAYRGAR